MLIDNRYSGLPLGLSWWLDLTYALQDSARVSVVHARQDGRWISSRLTTFVRDMISNVDDLSIVSAIISLAHSLNFRVIAEGVETKEQANLLRLLKCDEIQGFLFSSGVFQSRLRNSCLTKNHYCDATAGSFPFMFVEYFWV